MYRLWRDSTIYNGSNQGNNRGLQSINGRKVFSSDNKMFENPMGANIKIESEITDLTRADLSERWRKEA
jgi:hypothetical protein